MTFYGRLTTALLAAAAGGATALAALSTVVHEPAIAFGLLAGVCLGGLIGLARWVMMPLRSLLGEMVDAAPGSPEELFPALETAIQELTERAEDADDTVDMCVSRRVRELVRANDVLTLLFHAISGNTPGESADTLADRLFTPLVEDGTIRAAALWRYGEAAPSWLCAPKEGEVEGFPPAVTDLPAEASQPVLSETDMGMAAAFPVRGRRDTWAADAPLLKALVVLWPPERPPADTELVGLSALARYLGMRERIHTRSESAGVSPKAATGFQLKTDFLAHIGHQLRHSVDRIATFCEDVEKVLEHGAGAKDLRSLTEKAARLMADVQRAMEPSKPGWHPRPESHRQVGVAAFLEEAVSPYRKELEAGGVSVATDVEDMGSVVLRDAEAVAVAVDALLSNAARFTQDGGTITVRARWAPATEGREGSLVIQVADSGAGIGNETLARMCDPFFTGPETPVRPGRGTGLGLTLASHLIRGMGGELTAERGRDAGSTFTLRVPLAPVPTREPTDSGHLAA